MENFKNTLQAGDKLNDGKYVIVEVFGQGLFTITYLASQIALNRRVIIYEFYLKEYCSRDQKHHVIIHDIDGKIFSDFRDQWLNEAMILSRCCTSEQLVDVLDTFEENNTAYYITQYIQEKDLRDHVLSKTEKRLDDKEASDIILQIADGLDFIHQNKILHLNLSPSNVLIDKNNKPVIIQFGIALKNIPKEILKDPLKIIKPGYSPAEMYPGNGVTGPYSDIYSLGGIFYFLLTGNDPMPADERKIQPSTGLNFPSSGISELTRRIISKAMAIDPSDRYQHVTDLINDLKKKKTGSQKPARRWLAPALAGVLVILLVIIFGNKIVHLFTGDKHVVIETLTVTGQDNPAIRLYSTGDTLALSDDAKRGVTLLDSPPVDSISIGKFYGLFIGVQDYRDPLLDKLTQPLPDIQRMADILNANYVFDTIFMLRDPSRKDIFAAFDKVESIMKEEDNFLLFYAGHGDIDDNGDQGYWLPIDAERDNKANWISNNDIKHIISRLKARHILVISDACFGGSIMKAVPHDLVSHFDQFTMQTFKKKCRTSIASSFGEEVPDRSVFLSYLIENLQANDKVILTDEELYFITLESIRKGTNKKIPKPDRSPINDVGDNRGSFIFIRKNYQQSPVL